MPSKDPEWGQQRKQLLIIFWYFLTGCGNLWWWKWCCFLNRNAWRNFCFTFYCIKLVRWCWRVETKAVVLDFFMCIIWRDRCVPYVNWIYCFVVSYHHHHNHHNRQQQQQQQSQQQQTTEVIFFWYLRVLLPCNSIMDVQIMLIHFYLVHWMKRFKVL